MKLRRIFIPRTTAWGLSLLLLGSSLSACSREAKTPQASWEELRDKARESDEAVEVAEWLLAETLRPGGKPQGAQEARKRLDELEAEGVLSHLARGIDDMGHGRPHLAVEDYFAALMAAREWEDPRASLFAWFAATRVDQLSRLDRSFGARHRKEIKEILRDPGAIGFRSYASVVDMWAEDAFLEAEDDVEARLARKLGCAQNIALAGPFGTNVASDILRSFPAEKAGVWPERFEKDQAQASDPRRIKTLQVGCDVVADEATGSGVFYAQTFLESSEDRELILSAAGATHLWINDKLVLHRDVRQWGIWPKFGARVSLPPGRHRVVWKFGDSSTALRIVELDGRPALIQTSSDDRASYTLLPPVILEDPNDLMRYIRSDGVRDPQDELTRFIAAYMAHDEGQADVATVLFEPLVEDASSATGVALSTATAFVRSDPIFDESQTRDLVHELELRAAERDPGLWYPLFRNLVWEARQKGPTTVIGELQQLAQRFPRVAIIHFTLAEVYGKLSWGPEQRAATLDLVERFPHDVEAIKLGVDLFEREGDTKRVDELLTRLRALNPDSELFVARALNQQHYEDALLELRRLSARRPSRKDIARRIESILIRSGDKERSFKQLKKAVLREARDVHARLALADAELARGKHNSLSAALIGAVESGADPSIIEGAIDLMEGLTALEPYRLDGEAIIREYEAQNQHLPGTAARVLDYGVVWVRGDGSSRFLEHEIVRIQSEEAIKRFAETNTHGLILRLRVIKNDGRTMEPEAVAGKPTVTMPHLEVGDYIETERIISRWGDGVGAQYEGPGWFFREPNVAYARSEFVVIAPANKELILETHNGVPEPEVTRTGSIVIHRYRVDKSPAAPVEPNSPPGQEFLPRVAIGWGMNFEDRIRALSREMTVLRSNDPRIVRIAEKIAKEEKGQAAKARALYHWVLDSVQDGEESDGRRVVVSRNGNRWRGYQTLCRALGIPIRWALAESRLTAPLDGPIEKAQRPLLPLLVVGEGESRSWLTIDDKFAPFGTVPSYLRGEKAYLLGGMEARAAFVPTRGSPDGIRYEGSGSLSETGTATLDLRIVFIGTFATSLRNGLSQIPENQLENIIESRLLGQRLQGAHLKSFEVQNRDELERPLIISVKTEVPQFATPSSEGFLLSPPFMPRLMGLSSLAQRATPLLISQESQQSLDLKLNLPKGYRAQVVQSSNKAALSGYDVSDTVQAGSLHLVRDVKTSAGRISVEEYSGFQKYTQEADAALSRPIHLVKASVKEAL